jgi:prevent-host-death family protein
MSTHITVSDAKTQLSDLLNRVQAGERVTITVRGEPVADLVISAEDRTMRRKEAGAKLLAMMERGGNMTQEEVKEAREHGRR